MSTVLDVASPARDQRAAGRQRRRDVPRSAHAGWGPATDRPEFIATIEAGQEA